MRTAHVAVLAALALAAAGCGGPHLAAGFGRANAEAAAAQRPTPAKPPPPPSMRLDTQEAEVIAQGYVKGLAGKSRAEPDPVLFVAPTAQGSPARLAPSVPRN
jgi:hypothetical protein